MHLGIKHTHEALSQTTDNIGIGVKPDMVLVYPSILSPLTNCSPAVHVHVYSFLSDNYGIS